MDERSWVAKWDDPEVSLPPKDLFESSTTEFFLQFTSKAALDTEDANECACPDGALWEILTSAGGFMMDSIWDATDKDAIWF